MEAPPRQRSALREWRRRSGLTQAELAERAGVSRQLVAAAEAGQNTPAVDAAIRLAHALGTTAEALFTSPPGVVVPALGEPLGTGRPLRIGRVGDQLVAAELPDHGAAGAGWARPDAILEPDGLRLFDGANPAGLVLAGCDPAIGVAESMLQGLGARSLVALPATTGRALLSLAAGTVHAAVVHGPDGCLLQAPVPVTKLHLARWQVGLAHPRRLRPRSLAALLKTGVQVVQRDHAASSQQAFQRAAAGAGLGFPPAGPRAAGHLESARAAALLDCPGVTTEAAAHAFELSFLPLEEHTVEVWVAEQWAAHPAHETLAGLLASGAFTDRVGQFGGYELAGCGGRV